jgi:hypothetical protein
VKISLSVPVHTLAALEKIAAKKGLRRSRFCRENLEAYLLLNSEEWLRAELDVVYSEEDSSPDPWRTAAAYEMVARIEREEREAGLSPPKPPKSRKGRRN